MSSLIKFWFNLFRSVTHRDINENVCSGNGMHAKNPFYNCNVMIFILWDALKFVREAWNVKCKTVSGNRGRPSVTLQVSQLRLLQEKGFTAKQMAAVFKCSPALVYKTLWKLNMHQRAKYSSLTESELLEKVTHLHSAFPNSGNKVGGILYWCFPIYRHAWRSQGKLDPDPPTRG